MIFLDTKVVSETLKRTPEPSVLRWLEKHHAELALSTVVIAELAFGIRKIRPEERAQRLADGLEAWRSRFAGRIFAFTEEAALNYGELMGEAARSGRPTSAPDGRIAARPHPLGAAGDAERGGLSRDGRGVGGSLAGLSAGMCQNKT